MQFTVPGSKQLDLYKCKRARNVLTSVVTGRRLLLDSKAEYDLAQSQSSEALPGEGEINESWMEGFVYVQYTGRVAAIPGTCTCICTVYTDMYVHCTFKSTTFCVFLI